MPPALFFIKIPLAICFLWEKFHTNFIFVYSVSVNNTIRV